MKAVVLGPQLIEGVVVLLDDLVVAADENVRESRSDYEAMLDNVAIVVASRSSFPRCMRRISAAVKLIEIVAIAIIQELIARRACRHHRVARSGRT